MFCKKQLSLICLVFIFLLINSGYCNERKFFLKPYLEEKAIVLNYGIEVNFMMSEAEGIYGPDAFFVTYDHSKLFLHDPLARKIKVFDLKTKKELSSFEEPFSGILRQMYVDSCENIIYLYILSPTGETIITKNDSKNNTLFELSVKKLPSELVDQIWLKYEEERKHLGYLPSRGKGPLSWRFFSLNAKGEIFVVCLSSVLKYSSDGKFLGFAPGVGYPNSPFLFKLDPEENYEIGGQLSIFTEAGKKIRTINIPKDRTQLPELQKKMKYGWGPLIEITGVDRYNNVYLTTTTQISPVSISEVFSIFNKNNIYKFDKDGNLLNFYQTLGALGHSMEKQVQITSDGSIYYWKYFKDRMELWRILPKLLMKHNR